MSYLTWTAAELLSKALCSKEGVCWRVVEAQHIVSMLKLVDSRDEQALLDDIIEETKPPYPEEFSGYHPLIYTPFRYAPYDHHSRFRKVGQKEGVFYAAEKPETAIAEIAFLQFLFFQESPQTKQPENPLQLTAFSVHYKSDRAIDLTQKPLNSHLDVWLDKVDYTACQWLADEVRKASIELIENYSVRCPNKGRTIALFSEHAFQSKKPEKEQTWMVAVKQHEVAAICEFPHQALVFPKTSFRDDPRIRS